MTPPSFHTLYATHRRALRNNPQAWQWNDKISARTFATTHGLRVPDLYQGPANLTDLTPPTTPAVLKPIHGCGTRGVLALTPNGDATWHDHLRGGTLTWAQVLERATTTLRTGLRPTDPDYPRGPHIIEQLIHGPHHTLPHDWQLYCIHGNVALTRQSWNLLHGGGHHYWTPEWEPLPNITPTMTKWAHRPDLPPPEHPAQLIQAAQTLARALPLPFVRIDLYEDTHGPIFGEITPRPTGARLRFTPKWDRHLGNLWANP